MAALLFTDGSFPRLVSRIPFRRKPGEGKLYSDAASAGRKRDPHNATSGRPACELCPFCLDLPSVASDGTTFMALASSFLVGVGGECFILTCAFATTYLM